MPDRTLFQLLLLLFLPASFLTGQHSQSLVYGTVLLQNGERYQGQIRWENEEALWDDIFNAPKTERARQELLPAEQRRQIAQRKEGFSLDFMALWEDRGQDQDPTLRCQIGDIQQIEVLNAKTASVTFKNGSKVELLTERSGDFNDDLLIYDEGLGSLDLEWREIKKVVFQATPPGLRSEAGYPVYARVLTTLGPMEGFLTWDSEECLDKDLISGYSKGVKIDIEFANIAGLVAQNDGSQVTLHSGRALRLTDHDDVSDSNNGILVRLAGGRKVEFPWSNFISAEFRPPTAPGPAYDDFPPPHAIRGTVTTREGKTFRGALVYNLHLSLSNELLRGENNGFIHYIPFAQIQRIEPQNDQFASVALRDGNRMLLGNPRGNTGLLIRPEHREPVFIAWRDIKSIRIDD